MTTSLWHLTFGVVFNETLRASGAIKASEDGQVSQPVQVKEARVGGPVQADYTD